MTDRRNVDAVEGAIRDYVQALLDHRAGGIGAGPTVVTAQQSLREKLRAAFGMKVEESGNLARCKKPGSRTVSRARVVGRG